MPGRATAGVGDPQVKTDHPWYPGELSCSTFERLFATQAEVYRRVTGRGVDSDEDKALASWYWRNLNYWHGEEGKSDPLGQGFARSEWNRDYWTGLFAHGFGLCGTTHAQWNAEMERLLGHGRSRCVGVSGHNSFEVFLTGGAYGAGRWALLDHDISTVIFTPDGGRLMSIPEIAADIGVTNPRHRPERQRGWRVAGLADQDARGVFTSFRTAEYLAGYAGPPPMVNLRTGETLRRYLKPGLEDGRTFAYWGMNYKAGGLPGPERSRSWVNQPERMHGSKDGAGYAAGRVRYANAVFEYRPDFTNGTYKEGVVSEDAAQVTFEFRAPYVIACTPANESPWGIYDAGGTNGLVITGRELAFPVSVSVDGGRTWQVAKPGPGEVNRMDATDWVKGHSEYWLRLGAPAERLRDAGLVIRTVCQANVATIPHLRDGVNRVTFESSGRGIVSAGPHAARAEGRLVDGKIGTPKATLELVPPRGERAVTLYAASWQASGNPPGPAKYQIEYSTDGGKNWAHVVKDWQVERRQPEPADFWSQSFAWGEAELRDVTGPVRVRFRNDGGKAYRAVEAHLAYRVNEPGATEVTFAWRENGGGVRKSGHVYPLAPKGADAGWTFDAGRNVETLWVEYAAR